MEIPKILDRRFDEDRVLECSWNLPAPIKRDGTPISVTLGPFKPQLDQCVTTSLPQLQGQNLTPLDPTWGWRRSLIGSQKPVQSSTVKRQVEFTRQSHFTRTTVRVSDHWQEGTCSSLSRTLPTNDERHGQERRIVYSMLTRGVSSDIIPVVPLL